MNTNCLLVTPNRKAISLLHYMISQGGPATRSRASDLGVIPTLSRLLVVTTDSSSTSGDSGTDTRQAALSALLELARSGETWSQVNRQAPDLHRALQRLRDRHAALTPEDRDSEREEDELASELIDAIQKPITASAREEGGSFSAAVTGEDHVSIDLTEPNIRDAMATPIVAAKGVTGASESFGKGGGAMIACPRVDKF